MPTLDTFRRPLRSLRLSVTDRCNLRCAYCMPEEDYQWIKSPEILTFEELSALVDRFTALGVDAVRLTGGEPLVRRGLPALVAQLSAKRAIADLSLTTNGVLLAEQAALLRSAGLHRLSISLDTLVPARFAALTRRDQHAQVLAGLEAARAAAFPKGLKLDMVVMRGVNDDELVPMLDFAARLGAELRFIEYMDVGGATRWSMQQVVGKAELLQRLGAALGPVAQVLEDSTAPAVRFELRDGRRFGIIASSTAPFCRTCDRARLTADGLWLTCLYATQGIDLRAALRGGASAAQLEALIAVTWSRRADRGAEARLALQGQRAPLKSAAELQGDPHLEMHTRGG